MLAGRTSDGLHFVFQKYGASVAYCSLSVRCGTRAEEGLFPEGTAHMVEHTIFKGTSRYSAVQISSLLDRRGGELNAYTTKEEIVLHATVLKEDLPLAVGLLREIAFRATFPPRDIETERGVVLDEIISYKDTPADDIYDHFEQKLFAGSSLGRLILGTQESVSGITREDLLGYYHRFFIPSNMVLSIVADIPEEDLRARYCPGEMLPALTERLPLPRPSTFHFDLREDRGNHEANAVIGAIAPSLYDGPLRIAAVLLANILGGPASNSLLVKELREKHGWVYGVECAYTQYSDCGIIAISLGCDRENLSKCLRATFRIISGICAAPLSERALASAKRQILGQLAISSEGGETQCLSIGKSMLSFGRVLSDEQNRDLIRSVTSEDILSVARSVFSAPSTLVYL